MRVLLKVEIKQKLLNILLTVVIISSFTYLTHERNKVWHDDITLWEDAVEKAPDNARAHNNLGRAYGDQYREIEAVEEFKRAIRLLPNYGLAHMNLAVSYSRLDMKSEAESHYKKALGFYPNLPEIYYNYGFFLYSNERDSEAYDMLTKYLELDPKGIFVQFTYRLLSNIEGKGHGK